jgi:RNA polymerase sigma-70 factor (ECF subfamily)
MANQLAGQFTSVSEKAIRNENESRMEAALNDLSETDREILALRHIEQLSNSEIAIELEIRESAATNRYVRAIRRLRDALGE